MAVYERQTFTNEEIVLDGNRYVGCVFNRCVLIYTGGELPNLERCKFNSTRIQLDGAAQQTLSYMRMLSSAGLFNNVNGVIKSVKTGDMPIPSRPQPCDTRDTGSNYRQLGIAAGVLTLIGILLLLGMWYGFLYYPSEVVLGGEETRPLEAQIPLDVMPALPDNLADAYDLHNEGQSDMLSSYGWTDEENGIAHIPIEAAFEIIVQDGPPTWSGSGE